MEYETGLGGRDTDDQPHGAVEANSPSIQPGVSCPETMLVPVMTDGSCLLMAYPLGEPAVLLMGKDAVPLRRELAAAFKTHDGAVHTNHGEAL